MTNFLAVSPLPFAPTYGVLILIATAIVTVISFIVRAHDRKVARERAASMARHPAGKGLNAPRVLAPTRHIDRPGYDWVNGPL